MPATIGNRKPPFELDEDPTTWCPLARVYVKADVAREASGTQGFRVPEESQPVTRTFANGLLTCYLVDTEIAFQYVLHRHLHAARLTSDELHVLAVNNLAAFARGKTAIRDYGGVYGVLVDGNFEASLLAVRPFWDDVMARLKVGPEIAAAIPARDVLAFCDAGSSEGVARLRQTVARVYPRGDHLITNRLYRRSGEQWVLFEE
ncbi:MAG TPA: hypothetical protein VEM77_04345 [Thermoplasmata archaeon]|nr:hypothetical protein [Thermoplasmata archaeon]